MGHQRAFNGFALPVYRLDLLPTVIRNQLNVIMLADTATLFLETPDALPKLVDAFGRAIRDVPFGTDAFSRRRLPV